MPIYEFFCPDCNTVFNFLSRRPNTEKRPDCPSCGRKELAKLMSPCATIGKAREADEDGLPAGLDEARMERALTGLMREAEGLNEEDPRQMAGLMRKFMDQTGLSLGDRMQEAIARMESGEDPEQVERDMGDVLDEDAPFSLETMRKKVQGLTHRPRHDDRLYEL